MPVFLPTPRLLAALALVAPLFLLGTAAGLAVDALLLAAAIADALLAPGRRGIRIERQAPTRLSLGGVGDVVVELENGTGRPVTVQWIDDLSPGLEREGDEVFREVLAPWRRVRHTYRVRAATRGAGAIGDLHLRTGGPFGLVWRQDRIARTDPVPVQPGVLEVRRHRLLGLRHRLHEVGLRAVRQRGERGSFESLRDYARGDDPRTIDWKATARRAQLTVRRYEAERSQNVLLAIDAGRLMMERIGDRERIDHALSAALLLTDVAAAHGDRTGLLVFSDRVEQFLPPTRVRLSRLAEALGAVEPRLVEPDYPGAFAYLAQRLRRRSLIVLFTDLIDARASSALIAHLGRATGRHLPLAVALRNPALERTAIAPAHDEADVYRRAAAEELLQARAHALASMRRAGVLVADTQPEEAVAAVVNRYLEVKRRGLL